MPGGIVVRRASAAALAVVALAVAAAGCSGRAGAALGSGRTVELIVGNTADPFYATMACGAEHEASKLRVSLVVRGPASFTVPGQLPLVRDAVAARPKALLIAPTDATHLNGALERVQSAGTKIIFVDTSSADQSLGLSRISSDNAAGGRLAADSLGRMLHGTGTVAVLGMAIGSSTDARVRGFEQEIAARYPGISLLPEQEDIAATPVAATTFLETDVSAHKNLRGVFAVNTVTAQGAAAALRHTGDAGKIKMVTFDAGPAQLGMLQGSVAQLVIAQDPRMEGRDGIEQAVNAMEGRAVTRSIQTPLVAIGRNDLNVDRSYAYRLSTNGC
ncbi:MAG TPA: substrate-binding domain-containing protein [Streptosporangiaceae bacterium]